jgi:hypothetical protein
VNAADLLLCRVDKLKGAIQCNINGQRSDGQEGRGDVAITVRCAVVEQDDFQRLRERGCRVAAPGYLKLLRRQLGGRFSQHSHKKLGNKHTDVSIILTTLCNQRATLRMSMGAAPADAATTSDETGAFDPGISHMTYTRDAETLSSEMLENDTRIRLCLIATGSLGTARTD